MVRGGRVRQRAERRDVPRRGIALCWLANFVAVVLVAALLPSFVTAGSLPGVALFAAILALLNVFVKPVITLVTAPISCLTLGLFVLVINAFLFWLAGQLSQGAVEVHGILGAIVGAIVVSIVSLVVARVA